MNNTEPLPLKFDKTILTTSRASRSVCWPFVMIVGCVAILWMLPIFWLHLVNGRLLASWHGFLHTAIANQFVFGSVPPENPFYAGEILPYYWVYHFLGHGISTIFHIDPLHAFQGLSLLSLVVLIGSSALLGKRLFQSTGAGLLIGYLVLVGVNPLGPVIAIAKHYLKGVPLFSDRSTDFDVENIFVSWEMADALMTQSLLPAMYIMSNWKHGQNLVWFFDISSRTPALALVLVGLLLFLVPRLNLIGVGLLVAVSGITTSLSPLIGFAVAGSLLGGAILALVLKMARGDEVTSDANSNFPYLFRAGIYVMGCGLAYPAYSHLFVIHDSTLAFSSFEHFLLKTVMIGANFLILVPLALLGPLPGKTPNASGVWSLTFAGMLLVFAVPIFSIKPGNEHNLTNVAQCFLAVSAVWGIINLKQQFELNGSLFSSFNFSRWSGWDSKSGPQFSDSIQQPFVSQKITSNQALSWLRPSVIGGLVVLLFIPTTIGTLLSFTGRPPIPLGFQDQTFIRLPPHGALNTLYDWIKINTPKNAVFISDPLDPVKMSGNVAELPAFTGRTLLVGNPTYMTQAYKDRIWREGVAVSATHGVKIEVHDLSVLEKLGRPLYVITYHSEQKDLFNALLDRYGPPLFQKGFVAVFDFARNKSSSFSE